MDIIPLEAQIVETGSRVVQSNRQIVGVQVKVEVVQDIGKTKELVDRGNQEFAK